MPEGLKMHLIYIAIVVIFGAVGTLLVKFGKKKGVYNTPLDVVKALFAKRGTGASKLLKTAGIFYSASFLLVVIAVLRLVVR